MEERKKYSALSGDRRRGKEAELFRLKLSSLKENESCRNPFTLWAWRNGGWTARLKRGEAGEVKGTPTLGHGPVNLLKKQDEGKVKHEICA